VPPLIVQGLPEPEPEILALASDDDEVLLDDDNNLMETYDAGSAA